MLTACMLVFACGGTPVVAQDEAEIRAARGKIRALLHEAEKHEADGRERAAREARKKAEQIERELVHWEEHREREAHERMELLHHAIEGLEHSMGALGELKMHKAHQTLERITDELRNEIRSFEERRHGERERQVARQQIEALQLAHHAMLEVEAEDAADLLRRAIRAREVGLEGRRDEEARELRRRSPGREQILELLERAEEVYREFGATRKADTLSRLTEELWRKRDQRRRGDEDKREHEREHRHDRERAAHDLEVMKLALTALREAERKDAAELLMYAIKLRVIEQKGIEGEEAEIVRKRAPDLGGQIELLGLATELWQEFGHEKKAEAVAELNRRLRHEWQHAREREDEHRHGRHDEHDEHEWHERHEHAIHRLERIQERIAELTHAMHEIMEELEDLKRMHAHE